MYICPFSLSFCRGPLTGTSGALTFYCHNWWCLSERGLLPCHSALLLLNSSKLDHDVPCKCFNNVPSPTWLAIGRGGSVGSSINCPHIPKFHFVPPDLNNSDINRKINVYHLWRCDNKFKSCILLFSHWLLNFYQMVSARITKTIFILNIFLQITRA